MKPSDALSLQINMVDEYIARHWQLAQAEARRVSFRGDKPSKILIGGCGDSHHAALGLELALGLFGECQVLAMEAMRLARYAPLLQGNSSESTLVIGISSSGEVARTIEAIEIWNDVGVQTLAFTSNRDSTLAQVARDAMALPVPDIPHGPGLLSYLGSLLLGYATIAYSLHEDETHRVSLLLDQIPELLHQWVPAELERGSEFATQVSERDGATIFLGSGAAYGSARFGAAKVIESVGEQSWGQDVEEWAHLEYFCDPAPMPTFLLSAEGRAYSRELEIIEALKAIGRSVLFSAWPGGENWSRAEREALAPLALWAAPCAYANRRAEMLSSEPFRGFRGGRDRHEGGGASRIRSSARVHLSDLEG
jgi:glucosamine--fructose-6-phosphate aminotransferase (isomerizing)